MEQDDKVFAKALSLSPANAPGAGGGASLRSSGAPPHGGEGAEAHVREDEGTEAPTLNDAKTPKKTSNNVRKIRIERMMSKAELARRANLSVLTIDRVERGYGCRMDTKRKILEALGLNLADRVRVFGEEE
jgi:DNA-binding XRE family transcriptional regulator